MKKIECRYDWHQTAQFVTISVFSKLTIPEKTFVECNRVKANINIVYDGGKSDFTKEIVLQGVSSAGIMTGFTRLSRANFSGNEIKHLLLNHLPAKVLLRLQNNRT